MRKIIGQPPSLPVQPSTRAVRGGGARETISVQLEVVTPILGGAVATREVDGVDIIRVPTIRGHLRFWWRALYGHNHGTSQALYDAEKALWGGATDTRNDAGSARSGVEVRVSALHRESQRDLLTTADPDPGDPSFYAVWTAKKPRPTPENPSPTTAERYRPGTVFALTVVCPATAKENVRRAINAWILFGGYGGRTRRGVGSLAAVEQTEEWLPAAASLAEFERLIGPGINDATVALAADTASLRGALLSAGGPSTDAVAAWTEALDWLKDFRQGSGATANDAREPDPHGGKRPSRSRWPEADKVRRLSPGPPSSWSHPPRREYGDQPVWPRAGFGLPIIGQFQAQARGGGSYREPQRFEIRWFDRSGEHDRLGSPLIVKAMAVQGGFVPIALWLNRGYPAQGMAALRQTDVRSAGSGAPFDALEAPGDTSLFAPLAGRQTPTGRQLRDAFFGWLIGQHLAKQVV